MSDFKVKRLNPLCIVAMERLYLKSDFKTICREGDPEAASLLAAVGSEIPYKLAKRLGLIEEPKTETLSTEEIANRSTRPENVLSTREVKAAPGATIKVHK
jgi:hypothetical protein